MKVCIKPGKSGNVLVTIAIGDSYLSAWKKNALPGWENYCRRHGLGLIAISEELISKENMVWKKATWQKNLIGEVLSKSNLNINSVCYLDSDILISPFAPNIFDNYDSETIGLVSQINGLPQPLHLTLRRLAFLRHTYYDERYPLDSALFMSPEQIFEFHDVPTYHDYACMGLIVFNVENHHKLMRSWFDKYDRNVQSLTGGGDEPHMNFEIQNWGKITWLPYEFQALWTYEIAWKYPFLYECGKGNPTLIQECIEASLYANHFLHFAGSWHESDMWKLGGIFATENKSSILEAYKKYLEEPVTGEPKGQIKSA